MYVYSTEVDLSNNNGPGINEREFIDALLRRYSDKIRCVVPYPRDPECYYNPKLEYVFNHQGDPVKYPFFILALLGKLFDLNRKNKISLFWCILFPPNL